MIINKFNWTMVVHVEVGEDKFELVIMEINEKIMEKGFERESEG